MNPKTIFINPAGRLRSGWRLLVFIVVYVLMLFLLGGVIRVGYALLLRMRPDVAIGEFTQKVIFRVLGVATALGAGYVCAKLLEGLPWRSLGLTFHKSWFRDLLVGSLIGFVSLALATAIATIGRGLSFTTATRTELSGVFLT